MSKCYLVEDEVYQHGINVKTNIKEIIEEGFFLESLFDLTLCLVPSAGDRYAENSWSRFANLGWGGKGKLGERGT